MFLYYWSEDFVSFGTDNLSWCLGIIPTSVLIFTGFQRSTEQVITKWKSLKVAYYSARKHNKDDGYISIPYGQTLHELLGHRTPSKRRRNSGKE